MNERLNTMKYYDEYAEEFIASTINVSLTKCYRRFETWLKDDSSILDFGCAGGRDSRYFLEKGYKVTPLDACSSMCEHTLAYTGLPVMCMHLDELSFHERFDAIWCCAFLVHLPRHIMPDVIIRILNSLKQDGILFVSFCKGEGERVDSKGRFICSYDKNDIENLVVRADTRIMDEFETTDRRLGDELNWTNVVVKKAAMQPMDLLIDFSW